MGSSKEMADAYITIGEYAKANAILDELANNSVEYITWYMSLDDEKLAISYENCVRHFIILDEVVKSFDKMATKVQEQPEAEVPVSFETAEHYAQKFEDLYTMFNVRLGKR